MLKKIKIIHIGKFYPVYGGVEKVMYDLCDGLSKRGIQSDFLGANADRKKTEIITVNPLFKVYAMTYNRYVASTYLSWAMISQLRKIMDNYDIIHIHHPDPMACLALFLSGFKGKVICHWHSDIVKQKIILKFYKPLQDWMLRRSACIIGTSPIYLEESPHLQPYKNKLRLVPIGIPPVPHQTNNATVEQIKKMARGRKIVFSLGRLIYYKGYQYLIEAAQYLKEDICVIIGGKGPLKKDFEQKIADLHLTDSVFLVGRIETEDLASYFEAADLFCLPSVEKSEAFGIVQVEAMAYGKPIVATKIAESGVSWVNKDGVSGLNAKVEDSKDLAEKINLILGNQEMQEKLGKGAGERFEALFTQEKMVDQVLPIYEEALK